MHGQNHIKLAINLS